VVDVDELRVHRVVGVLGPGDPDVHVRAGRVRVLEVGVDRRGRVDPRVGGEVVVDDRGVQVLQLDRGLVRVDRDDLDARGGLVDLRRRRQRVAAVLQRDEAGRLQHEQRARLVGRVVRDGDLAAVRDLVRRGVALGRVETELVDDGRADGGEVVVRADVVVRQEQQVLELVQLQLALAQHGVRLLVVGEVHQLDVDALLGREVGEGRPVGLRLVGHADAHGHRVVRVRGGRGGRGLAAGAGGEGAHGEGGEGGGQSALHGGAAFRWI
jgi:hypothetical protein